MEESILSKELIEAFRPIAEINNAQFRQAKIMLAGFIALQEQDIHYMDSFMDTLFDFMDPLSETEMVMRQYYDYIATFDPQEAKERVESLEEDMGYMTKIVYAAGLIAQRLHKGQLDKGGNDYFELHLLKVASAGFDWKEKVIGFLHDATEDCDVTVEDVVDMLDTEISKITDDSKDEWWQNDWWQEWMEDIMPYPCEITHTLTKEERQEFITVLNLLNQNTASSREEYLNHISTNRLALKVKLNDLRNNMDITRIPNPTEKDLARLASYQKEYDILWATFCHICEKKDSIFS